MLLAYADFTTGITLIPGGGGQFEVVVNAKTIFSKKALGRYPEIPELNEAINAFLD